MDIIINAAIENVPQKCQPLEGHANFYQHVLSSLGYPVTNPPVADLLRHDHDLDGEWVVVTPIQWQVTHNDAMIIACGSELELSEQESRLWFNEFAAFVAALNIQMHYYNASTWLLNLVHLPCIQAKPVQMLLNQSLMPELSQLDETFFWQRFITESQMFFNNHPLHKQQVKPRLNGVWLWGNGTLLDPELQPLIADAHLFALAEHLSIKVNHYELTQNFSKNSVVILQDLAVNERLKLERKLQKMTVRWYWNNVAYSTQPSCWLSRLWQWRK